MIFSIAFCMFTRGYLTPTVLLGSDLFVLAKSAQLLLKSTIPVGEPYHFWSKQKMSKKQGLPENVGNIP